MKKIKEYLPTIDTVIGFISLFVSIIPQARKYSIPILIITVVLFFVLPKPKSKNNANEDNSLIKIDKGTNNKVENNEIINEGKEGNNFTAIEVKNGNGNIINNNKIIKR